MAGGQRTGVVHLELHTYNLAEAGYFFSELLGWPSRAEHSTGSSYLTLSISRCIGGGAIECGQRPPSWLPYDARGSSSGASKPEGVSPPS